MPIQIDQTIKVGAVFSDGKIKPVWFSWNGRQIRILKTTFTWKTHEGRAALLHFSVTDGQGLFEICYNTESMYWRIAAAEPEL